MRTLTLRGSDPVIQQLVDKVAQLAKEGQDIEIMAIEALPQDNSWDDILQNEQVMRSLRRSIEQAKNGDLLSEEETFKQLYDERGYEAVLYP